MKRPRKNDLILAGGTLLAYFVFLALIAWTAACGGSSSPTQPSYPPVAGAYSGNADLFNDNVYLGALPMTASVSQDGPNVTISTTIGGLGLHPLTGTINTTGFFTPAGSPDRGTDPSCGRFSSAGFVISFSGNTLSYAETLNTALCGQFQISATLQR